MGSGTPATLSIGGGDQPGKAGSVGDVGSSCRAAGRQPVLARCIRINRQRRCRRVSMWGGKSQKASWRQGLRSIGSDMAIGWV